MPKKALQRTGTVHSFNISPKGSYEGLLLQGADEIIQINFPQEWSVALAEFAKPGTQVDAKVEPYEGKGPGSHPVYQLLEMSNKARKTFPSSDGNESDHFSGKVERLNYALHGEVNGAVLDTGDFLHVKPHGAAALGLSVGMTVKGSGPRRPMATGGQVIEAEQVNGILMEKKPKPQKKAHH